MILLMNADFMRKLSWERLRLQLSAQIKAMRADSGWSMSQLAKRAKLQLRDVWRVENGYLKHITIKTLTRIAHAFDVALDVRFISLMGSLFGSDNQSKGG